MNNSKYLNVTINGKLIGTLAETKEHLIAFEYCQEWLENGYSISPFSLPLRQGVFVPPKYETFEGLFGVFADSLPDGWGRLLVDRLLLAKHINPASISSLTRLAILGHSGMGALEYQPHQVLPLETTAMSLDEIAIECKNIFDTDTSAKLDEIYLLGGSSGGARPKVYYDINGEEWLVKFPSSLDKRNVGEQEYKYSLCAKKCGLIMAETKLLPSKLNSGYFATKRFDRESRRKIHMVSVGGLLETSHRIPNLDYSILMQLTLKLTQSYAEVEKLFRLMCFNVFAHNRDDHAKNFSFLCRDGKWELSPAYDLTYSNSLGGEHATTINGNGKNPDMEDILVVAHEAKMDSKKAKVIAAEIKDIVQKDLKKYLM